MSDEIVDAPVKGGKGKGMIIIILIVLLMSGAGVAGGLYAAGAVYAAVEPGEWRVTLQHPGFGSKRSVVTVDPAKPHPFRLLSDSLLGYAWPKWVRAGVCEVPDAIFIDGFQPAAARVSLPSNGSGGAVGNVTRVVNVPGYGSRTVYLRVPPSYSPSRPMPLVLALHGQAGSPAAADSEALRAASRHERWHSGFDQR